MSDMRYIIENLKSAVDKVDEAAPGDFKPDPTKDLIVVRSKDGGAAIGSQTPRSITIDLRRKFEEVVDRLKDAQKMLESGDLEGAKSEIDFIYHHVYATNEGRTISKALMETILAYFNGDAEYYHQHFPPSEGDEDEG